MVSERRQGAGSVSVFCPAGLCPLHLLIGLDVTDYQQSSLHQYLEGTIRELFSLSRVSCAQLNLTLSIQSVDKGGEVLFRARLAKYQHDTLQQLRVAHTFRRSYLNQPSLRSHLEMSQRLPESNKVEPQLAQQLCMGTSCRARTLAQRAPFLGWLWPFNPLAASSLLSSHCSTAFSKGKAPRSSAEVSPGLFGCPGQWYLGHLVSAQQVHLAWAE